MQQTGLEKVNLHITAITKSSFTGERCAFCACREILEPSLVLSPPVSNFKKQLDRQYSVISPEAPVKLIFPFTDPVLCLLFLVL